MAAGRCAIFRCDASGTIGGGHVLRSMTLAHGLERAGWRIGFAVSSATLASVPALAGKGWRIETGFDSAPDEAARLRAAWPEGVDLVVFDHYGRSAEHERPLRPWARRRLVIDDLADRRHECEFLLDTTVARRAEDYHALVPSGTILLVGPRYVLMREEFRRAAEARRAREPGDGAARPVRRVVLAFGMTDVGAITDRVAGVLMPLAPLARFDAIIGPTAEGRARIEARAAREPRLAVHVAPPDVARIMAEADLAAGAGGQMTFERCCLGLPAIAVVIADNQQPSVAALAAAGALLAVRGVPALDEPGLGRAFTRLLGEPELRAGMAERAAAVCDGAGVERVVARLQPDGGEAR